LHSNHHRSGADGKARIKFANHARGKWHAIILKSIAELGDEIEAHAYITPDTNVP